MIVEKSQCACVNTVVCLFHFYKIKCQKIRGLKPVIRHRYDQFTIFINSLNSSASVFTLRHRLILVHLKTYSDATVCLGYLHRSTRLRRPQVVSVNQTSSVTYFPDLRSVRAATHRWCCSCRAGSGCRSGLCSSARGSAHSWVRQCCRRSFCSDLRDPWPGTVLHQSNTRSFSRYSCRLRDTNRVSR